MKAKSTWHHIKVIEVTLYDLEQAASLPVLGSVPERVCLPVKAMEGRDAAVAQESRAGLWGWRSGRGFWLCHLLAL